MTGVQTCALPIYDEPDSPRDVGRDDQNGPEDGGVRAGVGGGLGAHGALDVRPVDGVISVRRPSWDASAAAGASGKVPLVRWRRFRARRRTRHSTS